MAAIRLNWQNIRQYIWLIAGLLCFLGAFVFWILTDTKELVTVENSIQEIQVQIQPEKVAATAYLGGLVDEVRPLALTTRTIASGNHAAEFRGTKFIQENKKQWTVELFRSTDEDIVKSFLLKQADRENLIYLRLSGESLTEQYVLVSGILKSKTEAEGLIKQLTLVGLPTSIHPKAVQFDQYITLVNDLGADEMQGANKLYAIKLRSAPLPIIDETLLVQPKMIIPQAVIETVTKTIITRKDASGNVLDVQRSHSNVDQPTQNSTERKPVQQEISDPFN